MLRTDMRVTCKHCGGPHPAFECRKRSAQAVSSTIDEVEKVAVRSQPSLGRDISTAARKDVPLSSEDSPFARGRRSADGAKAAVDIGSNPRPTAGTQALPVDTNNPSSPKGSGVESLRTPTEGRKGRDSTSGGARAKLRDPSAVLTQTAAQPPVGTNSVVAHPRPGEKVSAGQHSTGSQAGYDGAPAGQSKFDKKAWMREYMKIYMARYREDVKSGKRTPKKKVKAS